MARADALFGGSRLYRQADEAARVLIDEIATSRLPFARALRLVTEHGGLEVNSASSAWELHARIRTLAAPRTSRISAYHSVPTFLQGAHESYYGARDLPEWLGPAFKVATALVWPNVHDTSACGTVSSHDAVAFVLEVAGLLDQLAALAMALTLAPDGCAFFASDGIHTDANLGQAFDWFRHAFRQRGRVMRFTDSSPFLHLATVVPGILRVLAGSSPQATPELAATPLASIPAGENVEFWAGLLSRLLLFAGAVDARTRVAANPGGLAVLGAAGFGLVDFDLPQWVEPALQRAVMDCFWTSDWLGRQTATESLRHLVVERPILRLTRDEELFATTSSNIVDSLSVFLDSSVGNYWERGGARLSAECFRQLVSLPFERDVAAVLRGLGFEAGSVSENGAWTTSDGESENLARVLGERPPGEIDVLAHHECGLAIVAECKALNLPFGTRALRNLHGKLSAADDDGFHENLRRKLRWVDRVLPGRRRLTGDPVGLLVVDRIPPFDVLGGPHPVVDVDILERSLCELLAAHGHE